MHQPPSTASVFPGTAWEEATPASQGLDAALLDRACVRFGEICGADGSDELAVVRHGRLVWQGTAIDRLHQVYSCTKSFASQCLGLLWDDGRCTPDTRVASILPQLSAHYGDITLGQLSSMTAGFAPAGADLREPGEPLFAAGTALHYGRQPDLLGVALTRLAGEPLRDLYRRRIADPVGIPAAAFDWGFWDLPGEPVPVNGGMGQPPTGVAVTARAMARLGWLWCQGGCWDGRQLLSRRYFATATAVQVAAGLRPHDPAAWYPVLLGRYGLGWWLNGINATGRRLWPSAPADAFAAQGNKNNICIVIPSWNTVVVRLGNDAKGSIQAYDESLDLLRQALVRGGGVPVG